MKLLIVSEGKHELNLDGETGALVKLLCRIIPNEFSALRQNLWGRFLAIRRILHVFTVSQEFGEVCFVMKEYRIEEKPPFGLNKRGRPFHLPASLSLSRG